MNLLQEILDWSEVWALFIPLIMLWRYPSQPKSFRPVIIYLFLALIINLFIDVGWKLKTYYPSFYNAAHEPAWLWYNLYLYNLHSILRLSCFSAFFIALQQPFRQTLKRLLAYIGVAFILFNFVILGENFFDRESFSSRLLSAEAGLLLLYCLLYFLFRLQDDKPEYSRSPDYWIVLGLSIYVVFNFFFFLFYRPLIHAGYRQTMARLWDLHNITYIVLCILIAKAFYAAHRQ